MLSEAIGIAARAHAGQVDKGKKPYILHPLRAMLNYCSCHDEATQICAVLHDVVEDTDITLDDLRAEGFSEEVLVALDHLTKRAGESYEDFISRVLQNKIACRVKIADLADNMDLMRIPNPTAKDKERLKKYAIAADRITEVLPGVEEIPNRRLVAINGVVEVHPHISEDQFIDMYIRFVEMHGWFFGGSYQDVTNDKE